jgi:Predicted Rossmann fold nucleotide-binding protein involved in DNA uptake
MKYTEKTLFVLSICEFSINGKNAISGHRDFSNADFYKLASMRDFNKFQIECEKKINDIDKFYRLKDDIKRILDQNYDDNCDYEPVLEKDKYNALRALTESADGVISAFDHEFPQIYTTVKKDTDKPYLLFYKGDISLLKNIEKNIAVIGLLNPENNIIARETIAVRKLVECGMNIVSGLARGCDTIAHRVCLEANGKTIAILPSTLAQIFPAENRELACEIVDSGGLLVSEYYKKPASRFESTKRFIDRDRLQAMFSKAILLSASYNEGKGDSGSRHAMGKAEEYSLFRAMLYDENSDKDNLQFGLNKSYHDAQSAHVMTQSVLNEMIKYTVDHYESNIKHDWAQEQQLLLNL